MMTINRKDVGGHCMCCLSKENVYTVLLTDGYLKEIFICDQCLNSINNVVTKYFRVMKKNKGMQDEKS